jgi:hypothetical protein
VTIQSADWHPSTETAAAPSSPCRRDGWHKRAPSSYPKHEEPPPTDAPSRRDTIPGVTNLVEIEGAKLFFPGERAAELVPLGLAATAGSVADVDAWSWREGWCGAGDKDVGGGGHEGRFGLDDSRGEELVLEVVRVFEDPRWSFDRVQLNVA